jgi:hypothetical protein
MQNKIKRLCRLASNNTGGDQSGFKCSELHTRGRVVTVWFDISKKHITTFISDTGEGIPQQHLS